ncbi:retrovirus-related Pol polyprotein from type-1 retrotransposable element R1 [Caerostris darwini]|uniref:Retrovirus-related Pol polyprotein from type-1 retrotransposable element R1 n=1 Tax=Caerostris darwini TaxID=1538125 RepID=A0AAV4N725_9ARAC|nr:retrovirus-related Pol polyprotein from type-1 retrotransposable element R1 [Caerostris darwini]
MANESTLDVSTIQGNETPIDNEQTSESNINAITFYNCIVNLTDSRDLKKEIKLAFRENAANLLKIISAQSNKIAQLEGRIFELEKYKEEESETRKKTLINETIAMAKPSFATVTKAMASKEPKTQKQIRPISKQKFITTIKPVEKEVDSLTTKKAVQRAIDNHGHSQNYKIIAHNNNPKAAIIIKDQLDCQKVFINQEMVIIDLKTSSFNCLLISIYCPPKENLQQQLSLLQVWIEKFPDHHIILLGDFNAKSRIWGKRNTDERGNLLMHFCSSLDLSIENNPDMPPTFDSTRGQSWIDLLITKNFDGHIKLEVLDEISNSDHNMLKIARIALIPKDGRQHTHPGDFRPYLYLPCWGKTLDKILSERLAYFLETRNLLNARQFGFRKHWQLLKSKIFTLNIPSYLKQILSSFLEDRKVTLGEVVQDYNKVATEALHILSGVPPLTTTLRYQQHLYRLRYLQQSIVLNDKPFTFNDFEVLNRFEPPWDKSKFQWRHMNKNEDGYCIYTDGSKLLGRVGCAVVCILDNIVQFSEQKRLSDCASVFMAELKAIEMAILSANFHHYPSVKIISDSRSVLQALANPINCSAPISLLKSLLENSTTSCELIWTRAHVGTEGNEIADLYAKEATTREEVDLPISLSFNHLKTEIAKAIKTDWQRQWSSSSKGRAVHELFPHVCLKRIHGNYFLNQIITGHGDIASYQNKFFNSSPVCSCGKETEDRHHLIFKCEIWKDIRGNTFNILVFRQPACFAR